MGRVTSFSRLYSAIVAAVAVCCCTPALAQWTNDSLQVHGFATQAFVFTTGNNYLGMQSTGTGTPAWTEGALNVNDRLTGKLRAGVQIHITRLGAFGGYVPTVDWAMVEYTPKSWLSARAGKVKIRWGLFNDTQDADVGYLWCLLPETIYGIDMRATSLSQYGAEAFGRVPLPNRAGNLTYSAYWGEYIYSTNDGSTEFYREQGLVFTHPARGKTPGFDLRYNSPSNALQLGASVMFFDGHGTLVNGSFRTPLVTWPTVYARYSHKRLELDAQASKLAQYQTVTLTGAPPVTTGTPTHAWFVMGSYALTKKLQAGSYYSSYSLLHTDQTDPANYFHETAVSARYDIDPHLYTKLEGHFIKGNVIGLYTFDNPNGFQPRTNGLVAKVGVTF